MIKSITNLDISLDKTIDRIEQYITVHSIDKTEFLNLVEYELLKKFTDKEELSQKINRLRYRQEWYQNLSLNKDFFDLSDQNGFLHSQSGGTCWIDSVSQILLNTEIISSIFKRCVFNFSYRKKILFPICPKITVSDKIDESLFFYFYSWYLVKSSQILIMNKYDGNLESENPELTIGDVNTVNSMIDKRVSHVINNIYCSTYDKTKVYIGGNPILLLKYYIQNYNLPISMKTFNNIKYNYGASTIPWIGLKQDHHTEIPSIGWTYMFAIEPLKFRIDPNLYAAIIKFKVGITKTSYHAVAFVRMNGKFYIIDNNVSLDPRKKKAIEIKPKIEESYLEFDLNNFGNYKKYQFRIVEHTAITINRYNKKHIMAANFDPSIIENKDTATLFIESLIINRDDKYIKKLKDSYHNINYNGYYDDFINKLNLRTTKKEKYTSDDFELQ